MSTISEHECTATFWNDVHECHCTVTARFSTLFDAERDAPNVWLKESWSDTNVNCNIEALQIMSVRKCWRWRHDIRRAISATQRASKLLVYSRRSDRHREERQVSEYHVIVNMPRPEPSEQQVTGTAGVCGSLRILDRPQYLTTFGILASLTGCMHDSGSRRFVGSNDSILGPD